MSKEKAGVQKRPILAWLRSVAFLWAAFRKLDPSSRLMHWTRSWNNDKYCLNLGSKQELIILSPNMTNHLWRCKISAGCVWCIWYIQVHRNSYSKEDTGPISHHNCILHIICIHTMYVSNYMLIMELVPAKLMIMLILILMMTHGDFFFGALHEYCRKKRAMGPFVTIEHVIAHCRAIVFTVHTFYIVSCELVPCILFIICLLVYT